MHKITVKVDGHVELPPDPVHPATYRLVGSTAKHPSNHWFTPQSVLMLRALVSTMYAEGWGVVGVNDGSLEWGGLFDISGRWTPSHHEHRAGNEVDLSVTNPNRVTPEQKKEAYAQMCRRDNTALNVQTLWHADDGYPEHYHVYLNGSGLTAQGDGKCCARYKSRRVKKDRAGNSMLDNTGKPVMEIVYLCEEASPR